MIDLPAYLKPRAPAIAAVRPPLPASVNDTGRQVWCGPVALSAITGRPASEIEALVREHRARQPQTAAAARRTERAQIKAGVGADAVVGTSTHDCRVVLEKLGWVLATFWQDGSEAERVTFGRWLERKRDPVPHYLVGLMARRAPHWVALKGVRTADTFSGGRWSFAVDGRHMGARLLDVHAVVPKVGGGHG